MGLLSGVSYGTLWIAVILLAVFGLWRWIFPVAFALEPQEYGREWIRRWRLSVRSCWTRSR